MKGGQATRQELYAAIGELAVAFSNLQHNVLRVLDVLAGGEVFLGPILLNDLSISRVLDHMEKYIKARLRENPDLRKRAETLVRDVHKVRVDRNRFIHGLWLITDDLLATGRVICLQYKFHYDKKTDQWKYFQDHRFTLNQLAFSTGKILMLCGEAMQLGKDIKAYLGPRK